MTIRYGPLDSGLLVNASIILIHKMLIWREIGVICEDCTCSMNRLVCCSLVSAVPEFSPVVLAVGVNERSRCGLAWGSAARNDCHCGRLNGQKF
jgi:hypothetical protein